MGGFTNGPWAGKRIDIAVHHFEAIGATIAFTGKSEEAMANARLIAAAPDMLAALLAAVECGMVPTSSATEGGAMKYVKQAHVADQIRAAIKKAKGGKA